MVPVPEPELFGLSLDSSVAAISAYLRFFTLRRWLWCCDCCCRWCCCCGCTVLV